MRPEHWPGVCINTPESSATRTTSGFFTADIREAAARIREGNMSLTLNTFIQYAKATNGRTRFDVVGDTVRLAGTNVISRMLRDMGGDKARNRNTVFAFMAAIARERGEYAARFASRSRLLAGVWRQGKPLTSALVRQTMTVLDAEMASVSAFNRDKLEALRADAGPDGMRALIRERCIALGMLEFASDNFVGALAGRIAIDGADTPYSDKELRGAVRAAVDRKLAGFRAGLLVEGAQNNPALSGSGRNTGPEARV